MFESGSVAGATVHKSSARLSSTMNSFHPVEAAAAGIIQIVIMKVLFEFELYLKVSISTKVCFNKFEHI